MTSDEPGISVSAAATRPPVQDSAVAMVSFRIRHRSSSERERARVSLPPMSIFPGKADSGAGGGGDAFLAPRKPQALAGRGLDRHPRNVEPGDVSDPRPHGAAMRADLRALADHRPLQIGNPAAAGGDAVDGVLQKFVGSRGLPLRIARREMRTDI